MREPGLLLMLIALLTGTGCQWGRGASEAKIVEPALPSALSRGELVDYLNRQTAGLHSWRCANTRVLVSMPGLPLPQKLTGSLACSAPGNFRLIADGALMVHADFGSNEDLCWAYVKPGESAVLTWRHEDSHLLQHLPGCPPRLEPSWLMTVLGIRPLVADEYQLQDPPTGSREQWLVAIEKAPDGTSLRRVIKVDTIHGVAREHALYDRDGIAIVRAQLSQHRNVGGFRMPHVAKISFPQNETELTLTFTAIQTDAQIADTLWNPPGAGGIEHVDLGNIVRQQMAHSQSGSFSGGIIPDKDDEFAEFDGAADKPPIEEVGHERTVERYDEAIQPDVPVFDVPARTAPRRRLWWNPFRR